LVFFPNSSENASGGVRSDHNHVTRIKLAHCGVKSGSFLLQEGGQTDRGAQFATGAHTLLKIDALLAILKLKFYWHGVKRVVFRIILISVVFVGPRGLAEEDHIAGAAQGVASAADCLGHVLPFRLGRGKGSCPNSSGQRTGKTLPVADRLATQIEIKKDGGSVGNRKGLSQFFGSGCGFGGRGGRNRESDTGSGVASGRYNDLFNEGFKYRKKRQIECGNCFVGIRDVRGRHSLLNIFDFGTGLNHKAADAGDVKS
jgi:hypothetical protein